MEYQAKSANPEKTRYQCLVLGVYEGGTLTESGKTVDKAAGGQLRKILRRGDLAGKAGQSLMLHDLGGINTPRVLLVGLGASEGLDTARFITILKTAITALKSVPGKNILACLAEIPVAGKDAAWNARRMVEQFESGVYTYTEMKGKAPEPATTPQAVDLQVTDRADLPALNEALAVGAATAAGMNLHRDLANAPGNVCTPSYLADQAKALAKAHKSIKTEIIEEDEMEKLGMGAFLSVSKGSDEPGKLIIMHHQGGAKGDAPHVVVGKGITFDTGGISLKPGADMWEMIYDMCGAASVFGVMKAVAECELPINVIGAVAAAENMPSGRASKPGDIVKTMSGQTVEILNTDAEGRLVLCDALTYIDKYKPASVLDIATLTGAMVVALGSHATGVFANDDGVAEQLDEAGQDTHDRVWRMPIWDDYQAQIASAFADMQNIGGRAAGSITAACFLSRFTKQYRWAHLDIAGTSHVWNGVNKGATARPVALLCQYLYNQVPAPATDAASE